MKSAKLGQKMSQDASEELTEQAGTLTAKSEATLASSRNFGSVFKSLNWKSIGRNFGIGVAAAVVSYFIDDAHYEKEKELQQETSDVRDKVAEANKKSLIKKQSVQSILATTK